jgi:hypothetical protein
MADAVTAMAGIIAVAGSSRIWRNAVNHAYSSGTNRRIMSRRLRGLYGFAR